MPESDDDDDGESSPSSNYANIPSFEDELMIVGVGGDENYYYRLFDLVHRIG